MIKSIELANISEAYSATNTMKFDTSKDIKKHMLWIQYVAWHCDENSAAPISDYINNPVLQELLLESDYFGDKFDARVYIDPQDGRGYASEIEKPSRNNSKLTVTD